MDLLNPHRRCIWVNGPVIVGAGPSGLAVAAGLKREGVPFIILERANCIASLWQNRTYDRLKLHLPKHLSHLPYFPFPDHFPDYPSKLHFISYLHSYATHFAIAPRFNETVLSAEYDHTFGLWRVRSVSAEYVCRWLVVATGENSEEVVPEIEGLDGFGGSVVHACEYKSGVGYRGQRVLVVGCGNSGMEVSLDLCHHNASPSMVARSSVHVLPREILGISTFELAILMMGWLPLWMVDMILLILAWLIVGNLERFGLKKPAVGPMALKQTAGKTPVLDTGALQRIRSGEIKVVAGIKRFWPGRVELVDGEVLEIDSVVLATGYRSNVPSWLKENEEGWSQFPKGWKSLSREGLYAVGFTQRGLSGASLDAMNVACDISRNWKHQTKHQNKSVAARHHRRCTSHF